MTDRVVIIVAPADDVHAEGVGSLVIRNGVRAVQIDSADFPSEIGLCLRLPPCGDSFLKLRDGEVIPSGAISGLWWRRPRRTGVVDEIADSRQKDYATINSRHALEGFVSALDCRVVNDIWAQRKAEYKAFQLQVAGECGLLIPETYMTNDAGTVRTLIESGKEHIYKSFDKVVGAADGTKPLLHDDIDRLEQLRFSPAIFQEFVDAAFDLRINYVNGKLFAAKITSDVGETRYDIRLDILPTIEPYTLPLAVAQQLDQLMRVLGLRFSTIDMRVDKDGRHLFLEVNPAGQWIYVEMQTRQPVTQALADYLCGCD